MEVNKVVKTGPVEEMPRLRVTMAEISEVKRNHILENLCYTLEEAGAIFSKGITWAKERLKNGEFIAVDENAKKGKHGLQPSQGVRVTALSVEAFRKKFEIAPERWAE